MVVVTVSPGGGNCQPFEVVTVCHGGGNCQPFEVVTVSRGGGEYVGPVTLCIKKKTPNF